MLLGTERAATCWGGNLDGELSLHGTVPSTTCATDSAKARDVSCSLQPIAISLQHVREMSLGAPSCALLAEGRVTCWGTRGFLTGDTAGTQRVVPFEIDVDLLSGSEHIAVWMGRVFGLFGDGSVRCAVFDKAAARACTGEENPLENARLRVRQLAADALRLCVVTDDDRVLCAAPRGWSPGCDDARICQQHVFEVPGVRARSVAVGGERICALTRQSNVACWGEYGSADASSDALRLPQSIQLPGRARALVGGAGHACAITDDDAVWCWGPRSMQAKRAALQVGPAVAPTPELIVGLSRVSELAGGVLHACALTVDGAVYCWGANHYGQLGDGSTHDSPLGAVQVFAPKATTAR